MFDNEEQFKNEYALQFGKPFSLSQQPDLLFLRGLSYWVRGAETGPILSDEWHSLYSKFFETSYFDEAPGFVTQSLLSKLEREGATVVRPGNLRRIFIDRKTVVGSATG